MDSGQISRLSPVAALALAFVAGVLFWGGLHWSIELSNRESFCIACHAMRSTVYAELQQSPHYRNPTGVRASCADCHVPKTWFAKIRRKIGATNELWHWLTGSIDTRAKFEAKRHALARHVWQAMRANDSLECRNCHDADAMDTRQQSSAAVAAHRAARSERLTCIDCHQGVAHQLPEAFLKRAHARYQREQRACWHCHAGMPRADQW